MWNAGLTLRSLAFHHCKYGISPVLKHAPPRGQVERAVIGAAHFVTLGMRQRHFDPVGSIMLGLVSPGRGKPTKAMNRLPAAISTWS